MNLKEYFVKASKGIKKRFDQNKQRNEILFNSLELQDHEIRYTNSIKNIVLRNNLNLLMTMMTLLM